MSSQDTAIMFMPNSPRPPRGTTSSVAGDTVAARRTDPFRCPVCDGSQRHPGTCDRSHFGLAGSCTSRPLSCSGEPGRGLAQRVEPPFRRLARSGQLGAPENLEGSTTSGENYSTARARAANSARRQIAGPLPGVNSRPRNEIGRRRGRAVGGHRAERVEQRLPALLEDAADQRARRRPVARRPPAAGGSAGGRPPT